MFTEKYVLPFPSTMVGGMTIIEMPTHVIDEKELNNLAEQIKNCLPNLRKRDIHHFIEGMISEDKKRFLSSKLVQYDGRHMSNLAAENADSMRRYNSEGFSFMDEIDEEDEDY